MSVRGLYDKDAAAEYLSTSPRRVTELRLGLKLKAVRDGREWKFTKTDLDYYISKLTGD